MSGDSKMTFTNVTCQFLQCSTADRSVFSKCRIQISTGIFVDAMRLIEIMLMLSFCGRLDAAPADKIPEQNVFMEKIKWTTWNNQSNNVKFDPNVILSTPEIIRKAGYPAETHVIKTEDGYLLTLHRIPGGNNSLPVLLQHGLLGSSIDWIVLGKGKALAYLLADQGYDVWLGNFRGNLYSRMHIALSPSNSTFWDFSFNEIGIYDLPAMIIYITNMRSQPLHAYIGHSMGTTSFYIMASERPEMARMVQKMISFAPTVFLDHIRSPARYLLPFVKKLQMLMEALFYGEFLQRDWTKFLATFCNLNYSTQEFCVTIMFLICGDNYEQLNYDLLPLIMTHDPAGASAKSFVHYTQEIQSGKFRQYDYGRAKNLLIYHSIEPPEYDLTNITVPIAMFYGKNDWLVDPVDVKRLFRLLPNVIDLYEVPWSNFNHVDFIWAKDAPKLLYERVFTIIRNKNPINVKSIA